MRYDSACLNTLNKKLGPLNILRTSTRGCFGRSRLGLEEFEFALPSIVGCDSPAQESSCFGIVPGEIRRISAANAVLVASSHFQCAQRIHTCRHFVKKANSLVHANCASNFRNAPISSGVQYGCWRQSLISFPEVSMPAGHWYGSAHRRRWPTN